MRSEFQAAIAQLIAEKGLPREVVMETVATALLSAYRKSFGGGENIRIEVDKNGEVRVWATKKVVAQVSNSSEEVSTERYRVGQRLRAYVYDVRRIQGRMLQIMVSRTHRDLVRRLFESEVPEIYEGTVEIKAIAREPGSRSKVAVVARQEGLDPIGSCVGVRGSRINNIVHELNDEKIDIIQWSPDPATFVANALSPVKPLRVELRESDHTALVTVPERQLSLAIGKDGQNARLAAKLTGWRVDVLKPIEGEVYEEQFEESYEPAQTQSGGRRDRERSQSRYDRGERSDSGSKRSHHQRGGGGGGSGKRNLYSNGD